MQDELDKEIRKRCTQLQCPFLDMEIPQYAKTLPCLLLKELLIVGDLLNIEPYNLEFDDVILSFTRDDLGIDLSGIPPECPLEFKPPEP